MKKVLFTLFILGATQGFSQQTKSKEQVVRPTVVQPASTGKGTEAPPASSQPAAAPQPATTSQPATTTQSGGNLQSAPPNIQQPKRKYVARRAMPAQKQAPAPADSRREP